ncbi:MAG: FecR domain-containing protein [Deltaproteobacteria bacterium]
MSDNRGLRPLTEHLAPAMREDQVAQTWRAIQAARARESKPMFAPSAWWATATFACAAMALLVWARPWDARTWGAGPVASTDPSVELSAGATLATHADAETRELRLDDGSVVTLAQSASLDVLANDDARFVTALRRGRCHFAVQPGGPRRWSIETGLATVEVVGTEFTVSLRRSEDGVEEAVVTVDHGVVMVSGEQVPDRVQRLTAGQELVVRRSAPSAATERAEPETDTQTETEPSQPEAAAEPETAAEPGTTEPETAAEPETTEPATELAAAAAIRPSAPGSSSTQPALGLLDATDEADRLMASGDPEAAAALLEQAIDRRARDAQRSLAAYQLGQISLDRLDQPDRAARAFLIVIRAGQPRTLVDDARLHRIEALVRGGRAELARRELAEWEAAGGDASHLEQARAALR